MELTSSASLVLSGYGDHDDGFPADSMLRPLSPTSPTNAQTTSMGSVALRMMATRPGENPAASPSSNKVTAAVMLGVKRKIASYKEFADFEAFHRVKLEHMMQLAMAQAAFKFCVTERWQLEGRGAFNQKRRHLFIDLSVAAKFTAFRDGPLPAAYWGPLVACSEAAWRDDVQSEERREWEAMIASVPSMLRRHIATRDWLDGVVSEAVRSSFANLVVGPAARLLRTPTRSAVASANHGPDQSTSLTRAPLTLQSTLEDFIVDAAVSCAAASSSDATVAGDANAAALQYFTTSSAALTASIVRALVQASSGACGGSAETAAVTAGVQAPAHEEAAASLTVMYLIAKRQKEVMHADSAHEAKHQLHRIMKEARQRALEERNAAADIAIKLLAAKRRQLLQVDMELATLHVLVAVQLQEVAARSEIHAAFTAAVGRDRHCVGGDSVFAANVLFSDRCHAAIDLEREAASFSDVFELESVTVEWLWHHRDRFDQARRAIGVELQSRRAITRIEAFFRLEVCARERVAMLETSEFADRVRSFRMRADALNRSSLLLASLSPEYSLDDILGHHEDRHRLDVENTERRAMARILAVEAKERRVIAKFLAAVV